MRIAHNSDAVSTLTLIILLLCSAVLGGIISYLVVMTNYYNMPEDTTLLIVQNVKFPVYDAGYFNVTILNPSNSASDANITAIRLSVEEENEVYNITRTDPELGTITRGTRLTFKCEENWSNFAGKTVRIQPIAGNASTKSSLYTTPKVEWTITPDFDASKSVDYFNLTIENSPESVVNLTISEIKVFGMSINGNVTPTLPHLLPQGETEVFRCDWNWENYRAENVTITVSTARGYQAVYTTNELPGAVLYIEDIEFDFTDTTSFNVTISSSEYSTVPATITAINITLKDNRTIPIDTYPPLGPISGWIKNESRTFDCTWNWSEHRDEAIAVHAYTEEGFKVYSKTVKTPSTVVWNITDVKFDLDHTDHFLVNVTNRPCSLNNITITEIQIKSNETSFTPQIIPIGEERLINCTFDWKHLRGQLANITVFKEDRSNVSRLVKIPSIGLKLLGDDFVLGYLYDEYPNVTVTIPYFNITISNSNNSLQNVTITKITLETQNETREVDSGLTYPKLAPNGYILRIGEDVTIICLSDWTEYLGPKPVTVTVYTAEGFQASTTWQAPTP